jgi:hypothetical protein
MTEGPVGELEELIARAFAQGPETMDVNDAATYLAAVLAPLVVLRSQLEHVGWYRPDHIDEDGDETEWSFYPVEEMNHPMVMRLLGDFRALFAIPPRVVSGTAHLPITIGMGATD